MQNKPQKKRKRWWQKLENWLYAPDGSYFLVSFSCVTLYWWRGLPLWILLFPSLYLIYGIIYHYKNSTPFWNGRKKIEKSAHPVKFFTFYFFLMLLTLLLIFVNVRELISYIFIKFS